MRRLALVAMVAAAGPLFGVYSYYVAETYSYTGPNGSNWTLNNSYQASADGIYSSTSQGFSAISTVGVPDGSSSYEVRTTVKVSADMFTPIYVHYLRASADALAGYSGSGTYYAVQAMPSLYAGGACSMGIYVTQRVSGAVSSLGYVTTGCAEKFTMQSVMTADDKILVYVNGSLVMGPIAVSAIATGKPGFGGSQMPAGSTIQSVSLGGVDRVAPGTISTSQVRSFPLWNTIDLEWPGALDDANGTGVYRYVVSRNGTVLGTTQTASFTDQTVAAGTNYTYAVQAIDMHGNVGAAATFAASSTASGTRDSRRVGVRPLGTYWGGGGEQLDVASGNLNFSIPLIKVMSRNGKTVPLGLSYNSQNWRKDANGTVWRVGKDIGYGFGWMLTAGFVKAYYSDLWTVHHYSFTNASGAEVRLDYNDGGIWRSTEGETVAYSPMD